MSIPSIGIGKTAIGIDVGGTTIKAGVFARDGECVRTARVATPVRDDNGESVLAAVAALARELRDTVNDDPVIGVVVPGIVDATTGIAHYSANLLWRDVPMRELLSAALGQQVEFGHDVAAAGRAESALSTLDEPDRALLIIGTGIAATLRVGGVDVTTSGAGEIGHSVIDLSGRACLCGSHGCLETVASARAIATAYGKETSQQVTGAAEVIARAEAGELAALAVVKRAAEALAVAIRQLVATVGTTSVVIGGGLAGAGETLFELVRTGAASACVGLATPTIRGAAVGSHGGILGAAMIARQTV